MFINSVITRNILRMTFKLQQVTKHCPDINTATLTVTPLLVLYYLYLLQKCVTHKSNRKTTEILVSGQFLNNPDKSQCKMNAECRTHN